MDLSTVTAALQGIYHHPFDASISLFQRVDHNHRREIVQEVPEIATGADISSRDPSLTPTTLDNGAVSFSAAQPAANQWANWLGEEVCTPIKKTQPGSLEELVSIITSAGKQKQRVRAVGAGHSMSDVARTDDAVLVGPDRLAAVTDQDRSALNARGRALSLVRAGGGTRISDLNTALDNRGLALTHMGAYDGQTISGAFSTGTHGSGAKWGPMASMIRALVLVSENGTVYQIEPAGGITDAGKFAGRLPEAPGVPVTLVQDDDWFNAAQVAMGSLGVIYSYTLEVTSAFNVAENRTATKWDVVKAQFAPGMWNPLPAPLADFDRFELVISPYPDADGTHPLIWTERQSVGRTTPRGERKDFTGRVLEDLGILSTSILPGILNLAPSLVPTSINAAMDDLVDDDAPYIDKSYRVFKQVDSDLQLKAHGLELHFPAQNLVATMDKILTAFKTAADQRKMYIAGPIGIRFTAPSTALLAPESGRLTATAELDNIVGIDEGVQLLREVMAEVTGADRSIRVHWGLELDTSTPRDVRDWYGANLDRWLAVYNQLNANGMFSNKFTDRLGL